MNPREERGLVIAATCRLSRNDDGTWKVPSQTNKEAVFYTVTANNPCWACGKTDWCRISEDGDMVYCRRNSQGGREKSDKNGDLQYVHVRGERANRANRSAPPEPRFTLAEGGGKLADPDTRHRVYSALIERLR